MTISTDPDVYTMHGSTFTSYVSPSRGSEQLCAWRLDVAAHTTGVAHRVTHEEVLLVLDGELHANVDDEPSVLCAGDVVRVPAGATLRVSTGDRPLRAWVTTSVGLAAVTADGTHLVPPWTL